jgi:hypothetical protein
MKFALRLLDAPGEPISVDHLSVAKARDFCRFLLTFGTQMRATFRECRRLQGGTEDVIVFSVSVERPQRCVYDIRKEEVIAATFSAADDFYPKVLALRADFPAVPHVNLTDSEFPRSLCLYDQPYENIRLSWTPSEFLYRIHHWLAATATGTLHGPDQPLEPLIQGSFSNLIVPSDFFEQQLENAAELFDVIPVGQQGSRITFALEKRGAQHGEGRHPSIAAVFRTTPQAQGIMRRQPTDLRQLHEICMAAGLDLGGELRKKLREWYLENRGSEVLKSELFLILLLPKLRNSNLAVEDTECWAFLTLKSVEEVGSRFGVMQKIDGQTGYIIETSDSATQEVPDVPIGLLHVHKALSPQLAARMNAVTPFAGQVVAVGAGSLGSQIINNFARSGFGRWTLIDNDILLPHNCARHLLLPPAVGQSKAIAVAKITSLLFDGTPIVTGKNANAMEDVDDVDSAFLNATAVFDFSASVPVSRKLARSTTKARHLTAFLAPGGASMIVAVEDKKRNVRLDWLEMLHYRAMLRFRALRPSTNEETSGIRYGNGCRDISNELGQDVIGTWAGVATSELRRSVTINDASLIIFNRNANGSIHRRRQSITDVTSVKFNSWTVRIDKWVKAKLARMRSERLPNETGGILLGNFDTYHKICYIIDIIGSPPDSSEWPTSYIRGVKGLREQVENAQARTLGNVTYVGEWHSHPKGCRAKPSEDDLKAYAWLVELMNFDSLPAVMLIVADEEANLVTTEIS